MPKQYPEWTLIDWDGNPDLHLKCWRKSFGGGRGYVSVGVGEFDLICYSHGANSGESMSSTRWRGKDKPPITEEQAMERVDWQGGYYRRGGPYEYVPETAD